jgi:hypothetical protein
MSDPVPDDSTMRSVHRLQRAIPTVVWRESREQTIRAARDAGEQAHPLQTPQGLEACEAVLLRCLDELVAATGESQAQRDAIRKAVLALNDLDEADVLPIETVERDELCEWFAQAAHAVGYVHADPEEHVTDEWRDW